MYNVIVNLVIFWGGKRMKKLLKTLLSFIGWFVLLLFFILLVFVSGKIFMFLWIKLMSLQKEVAAAIIASSSTVIVSVIAIITGKYLEKKQQIAFQIRNNKIPVYEDFINGLFDKVFSQKINGKEMSKKELDKFLIDFTKKLIIWGADPVIGKWASYRKENISRLNRSNENDEKIENSQILFDMERLLYVIRKDIGHKNINLEKGDLLRLFVNDIPNK